MRTAFPRCIALSISLSLLSILALRAVAQTPGTGAIVGLVSDPSGAIVAKGQVTATNESTGLSREGVTNTEGLFRVSLLSPGRYSLSITTPGFQTHTVRGVNVAVSETTSVDIKLVLAAVASEHVNVISVPELAQTQSSSLGIVTDEKVINSLPLANRNFTQILALSPGVIVELPNAGALGRNTQNVSANGARTTANSFQFNGVDANNISENSFSGFPPQVGIAIPAPDTIAEFKVQTGMYDAGYGRGAGANVDVISRSGSNSYHGSLWEFFRNDALNANDFFLKRNDQPRPVLKQNQFGGAFGGPIRKNKTFFFGSYQGTRQRNGVANVSLQTAFLPPLTDDRSAAALGKMFGGQSGAFGGVAVAPDGSNISPVALNFLNFKFPNGNYAIPTPQTLSPSGFGQSSFSIPASFREDQFSANIDHSFTSHNQLSGHYFYSYAPITEPFSPFGANVPGWGLQEKDRNHMFVLSDSHVFSPALVNVARFGYMRFNGFSRGDEPIAAADVGMATPSGLPEIPGIVVGGLFTIGTAGEPFFSENTNSFIWQDTLSITRGRHSLRIGGEAKRHQLDVNVPFVTDGFLFFLSFPDFLLGKSATDNASSVSNVFSSTGASGLFRKDERYTDFSAFIQDDIKLSSRLTVNAGLRYDFFGPPSEINGHLPNFDPSTGDRQVPASGSFSGFLLPGNFHGTLPAGYGRTSGSGMWNNDYKNFGPRLGFALRLLQQPTLVLRGGYGLYYSRLSAELAEQVVGAPPFSFTQTLQGAQNGPATFANPYVPPLPPTSSFPVFIPRTPDSALSVAAIGRNLTSPYVQQYDLNLQYEFARDFLWQLGYVGSKGTHLTGCIEFNQAGIATADNPVNGQTTTTLENLTQRLPYSGLAAGRSYICQTSFDSNYNSLQTSLVKRFTHGLNLQASYTWSKNLDYTSGTGGLSSLDLNFLSNDQTNPRQARGLDDFDRTHRFVLSFVYAAPRLTEGPRFAQVALSHWQFSGQAVLQSGIPITAIDSTAGTVYGNLTGFSRAECTGANPASSGSVTQRLNGYLNPDAFAAPPVIGDGTGFGSCGVGILRGPSQQNLDLGIQRDIPITEGSTLQFRAEFFNFTNTPKFGQPVNDHSSPAFGVISSTVSNPRIIQFALKYNF
jgi:hypothetical protein